MKETLISLTRASNSSRLKQDDSGIISTLGRQICTLRGDKIKINDNIYELTSELHETFSSTFYTGKTMKNENNIRTLYNILK